MLKKRRLRLAAALGAAVVALGMVTPVAANAAPTTVVDPTADSSLTIYKFDGIGSGTNNNGSKVTIDPLVNKPLEGASFTIIPVGHTGGNKIDLSTNSGWEAVSNLATSLGTSPSLSQINGAGYSVGTPSEKAATLGGDPLEPSLYGAQWKPLAQGLYYVYESATPAGYQAIEPFLVTIPMTNPAGDGWMYDVYVYPKNSKGAEKTPIDFGNPQVGDALQWKIDALLPSVTAPAIIDFLAIRDALDGKLDYVSTAVTAKTAGGTDVPLTIGTDYTVATPSGGALITSGPGVAGQTVEVKFTATGLLKLRDQAPAGTVTVLVNTKVNAAGAISNKALTFDNETDYNNNVPNVETPPVVSKSAILEIEKVDKDDALVKLENAEFHLYWDTKDTWDAASAKQVMNGANPAVGTTDANGLVKFGNSMPLRYSDFASGVDITSASPDYIYYYLVETKAPNKYELLSQPHRFEILKTNVDSGTNMLRVTIGDVLKGGGFELPFTGGVGTAIFLFGGVLVLAGVAFQVVRYSRRNKTAAN